MSLPQTTTLELIDTTKNTYKYEEPAGQVPLVNNIYLQKHQVDGDPPDEIEVTVEEV